jgi:hypothetical protein
MPAWLMGSVLFDNPFAKLHPHRYSPGELGNKGTIPGGDEITGRHQVGNSKKISPPLPGKFSQSLRQLGFRQFHFANLPLQIRQLPYQDSPFYSMFVRHENPHLLLRKGGDLPV